MRPVSCLTRAHAIIEPREASLIRYSSTLAVVFGLLGQVQNLCSFCFCSRLKHNGFAVPTSQINWLHHANPLQQGLKMQIHQLQRTCRARSPCEVDIQGILREQAQGTNSSRPRVNDGHCGSRAALDGKIRPSVRL